MKKAIVSAVSFLIFFENFYRPAVANQSNPASQPVSSFSYFSQGRVGVGLAAEYFSGDTNVQMVPESALGNIGVNQSQVGKKAQPALSVEIGGINADVRYLGFIMSWHYAEASNSARSPIKSANFFSHDFRMKQYADFMIKPGYKLTPNIMIYALFGPTLARWTHTSNQFNADKLISKIKIDRISLGLGLGGGFEYCIQKRHAFSVDYTYHYLSSASKKQYMSYVFGLQTPSGIILKKAQPSYATIAVRYTLFFQL